jgi:hypothetical protein
MSPPPAARRKYTMGRRPLLWGAGLSYGARVRRPAIRSQRATPTGWLDSAAPHDSALFTLVREHRVHREAAPRRNRGSGGPRPTDPQSTGRLGYAELLRPRQQQCWQFEQSRDRRRSPRPHALAGAGIAALESRAPSEAPRFPRGRVSYSGARSNGTWYVASSASTRRALLQGQSAGRVTSPAITGLLCT